MKNTSRRSLPTLFCPDVGSIIKWIRAIDQMGIKDDMACVSGIGCSSWIPCYLDLDVIHSLHGRSLAFAQGLKLARPTKKLVSPATETVGNRWQSPIHSAARK
jgi:2-oxoglutarate ferredoxin oxidoreductase subunit beta